MGSMLLPVLILFFLISGALGLFLSLYPSLAIELQKKFYEKINWRMEPISMQKEVRNTRIMGLLLIVVMLLVMVYVFAGGAGI
jgi:hypothetical protein